MAATQSRKPSGDGPKPSGLSSSSSSEGSFSSATSSSYFGQSEDFGDAGAVAHPIEDILPSLSSNPFAPFIQNAKGTLDAIVESITTSSQFEIKMYNPTERLLNVISQILHENSAPLLPAILFLTTPPNTLGGDYLDTQIKPDIQARIATSNEFTKHLQAFRTRSRPPVASADLPHFGQCLSPIEIRVTDDAQSKAQFYVQNIKRYRVDLPYVVGLGARHSGFRVWRFSPCDAQYSDEEMPWNSYEVLFAYVAAVYASYSKRNVHFTYIRKSQVWRLSETIAGQGGAIARVIYAGRGPGRTTWVALIRGPTSGLRIFKASWIDTQSQWKEPDLYRQCHREKDIPGLTKLLHSWDWECTLPLVDETGWVPYRSNAITTEDPNPRSSESKYFKDQDGSKQTHGGLRRVFRCLVLDAAGYPLTECGSLKDVLMVIYDGLEVSKSITLLGIGHRDISFWNVMCGPIYSDEARGDVPRDSGYIEAILYVHNMTQVLRSYDLQFLSGRKNPRCRALVTDLDYGAVLLEQEKGKVHRTGTPMFMALDFARTPMTTLREISSCELEYCCAKLRKRCQDAKRAFPTAQIMEPESNLDNLVSVLGDPDVSRRIRTNRANGTNRTEEPKVNTIHPLLHRPRHDAESFLFLLVFLLVRACPLVPGWGPLYPDPDKSRRRQDSNEQGTGGGKGNAEPRQEELSRDTWIHKMLLAECPNDHSFKMRLEMLVVPRNEWDDWLDPRFFSAINKVLSLAGIYFRVDWRKREEAAQLQDIHAHVALQTILLDVIRRLDADTSLDVDFHTEYPRLITLSPMCYNTALREPIPSLGTCNANTWASSEARHQGGNLAIVEDHPLRRSTRRVPVTGKRIREHEPGYSRKRQKHKTEPVDSRPTTEEENYGEMNEEELEWCQEVEVEGQKLRQSYLLSKRWFELR